MSLKNQNLTKAVLSLLSMVFLVYIGSNTFKRVKVDMTEEKIYTLSEGSQSILKSLDSPLKLKLYYSKVAANKGSEALRAFNNHFYYVSDLLREYVGYSRNNLQLQIIDPRPDTTEEEDAIAYGLKAFQLTGTEKYFFGMVVENETGTEKIIEFFNPGEKDQLEYDLTKLIYTIQNPERKTVGIISSLTVVADRDLNPYMARLLRAQGEEVEKSWVITHLLKELYEIKKIKKDTDEIPQTIDVLAIIHPTGFPEKTLFAIDQYLMKGGSLLVLTDPHPIVDVKAQAGFDSSSPDEGFKKLMDKWGVEVPKHMFAGDKYLSGVGQSNQYQRPQRLIALLDCNKTCSEKYKDPVSSGIKRATFVYPGVLREKEVEGLKVTPILSTSDKGNFYTAHGRQLNNPSRLWDQFSEGEKPVVIAQKIIGQFKTAFPEGRPPEEDLDADEKGKKDKKDKVAKKDKKKDDKKDMAKLVKESPNDSAVIIFSDVDFITDSFAFRKTFMGLSQANDSSTLFLNAVEALSGDVDLMSVRSKGRISRSFDVIEDIEFAAEEKTEEKVKEINASIARFQSELNRLGSQANEGNIALLQNEGLKKRKELAKNIALLKKELRSVKREGREKVETIGRVFQYINTLLGPFLVILFGFLYSLRRKRRMKMTLKETESNDEALKLGNMKTVRGNT